MAWGDDWLKNGLPTFDGGKDKSLARSMIDGIGGTQGFRTKIVQNADGSTTMLRTKNGMPQFFTEEKEEKQATNLSYVETNSLDWTAQASGFNSTHFGTPVRGGGIACQVVGISPGTFGAPSAKYPQFGVAGIQSHAIFGTPRFPLDASLDTLFVFHKTNRVDVWSDL